MKQRPNYAFRIAKDHDGVLPYHEIFYIRSIRFSADRALAAFARYNELIADQATEGRSEEIIFTLQEALGHCAAVSRYFWPISDEKLAKARGQNLCRSFELDESNALFQVRSMRNAIEHFDERLDRFCSHDPMGTIFDLIVERHSLVEQQVTHVLRMVDPDSQIIVLFGKKQSFAGLEKALRQIVDLARAMDANGGRLRRS